MGLVHVAARTVRWSIAGDGAARGRGERAAVILELRTEAGVVGLGEAAPLPGTSPDTLDDAERAIAAYLAYAREPPDDASHRAAAYTAAAARSPAARFAIETAQLDAAARERGATIAAWLAAVPRLPAPGAAEAPDQASRTDVALVGLPLAAVVDDPAAARRARAAGVRCLKIKLGADDDPGRVHAIAAAVPDARLRIDANRSWPRAEVAARLAALADLPIDYVEEPCRDAHRLLGTALPYRLALDESLVGLAREPLDAALRSPQLAALVLKPTLLGGFHAVRALARRARDAGVAAIVSHALEGPIGTAACAELALALGGDHPVGLAAHPALAGWGLEVAQLAADQVHPARRPGLGFPALDLAGVVASVPR